MLVFVIIAAVGFLFLVGSHIFGGDHDIDHEHDVCHDMGDHDGSTVSIFSMKVMATFVMCFGAGGAIARYYGFSYPLSSLIGASSGVVFGFLMWLLLKLIYGQQSSSLINVGDAIGKTATVTTPIDQDAVGEVGLNMKGQYSTYMACSCDGKPICKGKSVIIERVVGGKLTVKEI